MFGNSRLIIFWFLLFFLISVLVLSPIEAKNASLTLEKAYNLALKNNENVQVSRERLTQAQKDIDVATSNLYPHLLVEGSWNRKKELTFGSPDEYKLMELTLDQHIYQLGKVWSGRRIAKYYFHSSRFRHYRRVKEILFQVSSRYYNVLLGRRSIEIAQNALTRAKKQLDRALGRYQVGVLTKTDVLRAKVQVAQAREQLERAKNQFDVALERLALELGISSVTRKLKEPQKRHFSEENLSILTSQALQKRQDLEQFRKDLDAAKEKIEWEKADFFPKFSFQGQYSRTDEKQFYFGEMENWRASINLSYPLFSGGQDLAEVSKARSEYRQARLALKRLEREIRTEVRSVYLDIQTQVKVIQELEAQVLSARRNYKQVTAQFEEGLASSVDQVDAFTALNQAEHRLARARYTYQLNLIRLRLAIGTFQSELFKTGSPQTGEKWSSLTENHPSSEKDIYHD